MHVWWGGPEWKKRSPFSIRGAFGVISITPQSALPALVVLLPPSSWLFIPTRLCVLAGAYVQSCDPADHKAALEQVLLPGAGATAHTQITLCESSDHRLPLCTRNTIYRNFPLAAKLATASHLFKDRPPIPNPGAATADFVRPRIQKTPPASSNCTS